MRACTFLCWPLLLGEFIAFNYLSLHELQLTNCGQRCNSTCLVQGVVAVVTGGDAPDVLSHAAVRARNCSVLLAACFDNKEVTCLQGMAGRFATLTPSQVRC